MLCVRERLGRLDAAVLHAPNPPNELNLAWIVPQYLLVSVAEIMFAVSGLEFAFTQVGFQIPNLSRDPESTLSSNTITTRINKSSDSTT